jgi:hypothetical protein
MRNHVVIMQGNNGIILATMSDARGLWLWLSKAQ